MLEQAAVLGEIGAGIQMSPNAMHVLTRLGVSLSGTFRPEAIEMRLGVSGRQIFQFALGDVAETRWGAPYLHIHRADLHAALLARVAELDAISLTLGTRFALGDAQGADLTLGADGLHSVLRAELHGLDKPRFTGSVAWRFTVPRAALSTPPPPTACAWSGPGRHAVTYYLRGGELANFVGVNDEPETGAESWDAYGQKEELQTRFAGWHPVIADMINAAAPDDVRRWPLYDRAPLPFWSKDNMCILGDAAHPMVPSVAQGAAMALEDAYCLADVLEKGGSLEDFYKSRIARVSKVQATARANLNLFHVAGGVQKVMRYGPLWAGSRLSPRAAHRRLDWLYGWEAL